VSEPVSPVPTIPSRVIRLLGGLRRSGRFALQARTLFVALIGGVDLDVTEATVPPTGATLTKVSLIGGVDITSGPAVRVEAGGFSLVGRKTIERHADTPPTAPVLEVRSYSLVGGVRVRASR
jgi:hypothetical protein